MMTYFELLPGNWRPCHNRCDDDVQWAAESHNHNKSADIWKNHRAFMDNGDMSDYQWLYNTFHGSRFIMNVRPLRDWVLSRYDMVREIRLGGGCSPEGSISTCGAHMGLGPSWVVLSILNDYCATRAGGTRTPRTSCRRTPCSLPRLP